jgi:tetratricopeptide (TPR) repeat protein
MKCRLTILVGLHLISISFTKGQVKQKIDSVYDLAVNFYNQKDIGNAKTQFERVINLNPKHKDAIFNLGVINLELRNKAKAIELFQTCVRLNDRSAADLLKTQFGQAINCYDTMHLDDVQIPPKVLVNAIGEDILIKGNLNKFLIKQITDGIKKSKIIKKEIERSDVNKKNFLSLYFRKDGKLGAKLIKPKSQQVQDEITTIFQKIQIIPAKCDEKEVVTWGLTLPLQL